jgi:hypothetical protein
MQDDKATTRFHLRLYVLLWCYGINVSAIRLSNPSDSELLDFVERITILLKKHRNQVLPSLALIPSGLINNLNYLAA